MTRELLHRIEYEIISQHRADTERGGCTCGFVVWNVEHCLGMFVIELERHIQPIVTGNVTTRGRLDESV